MGYRIAICDDERSQAEELRALVLAWGKDAGADCAAEIFASAEAFLFAREGACLTFCCWTWKCRA